MEKLNCIRIIRKANQIAAAVYIKEFCKLCGFFTEDYEIEYEKNIHLTERKGWLNLFFVSKEEIPGTGNKNLYIPIDENINLVTESLRKDFGQNIRKYIVQDIPNILKWNKGWSDDITNLYDIFVSEDFAHHNYLEEIFNFVIGGFKSSCTSKEQLDYYKNFSSLIIKYISDNDDNTRVCKKIALCYCLKKANIYARRSSCRTIGNDLNMMEELCRLYRTNPDLPNLLWSAFSCTNLNHTTHAIHSKSEIIIKHLLSSSSHKCEQYNLDEWTFFAKYYVIKMYTPRCSADEYWFTLGKDIFKNILNVNPKCYQALWYKFVFHYNHFKHMNSKDFKSYCLDKSDKEYYEYKKLLMESKQKLRDMLINFYLLMLNDLKKGKINNPIDLRIFYNCIEICKTSDLLSESDKKMIKLHNEDIDSFERQFQSLQITKKFVFSNDISFENIIRELDPSNHNIKRYINEY